MAPALVVLPPQVRLDLLPPGNIRKESFVFTQQRSHNLKNSPPVWIKQSVSKQNKENPQNVQKTSPALIKQRNRPPAWMRRAAGSANSPFFPCFLAAKIVLLTNQIDLKVI